MTELLNWSIGVPWLAFICVCALYYFLRFVMRSIVIAVRGWPPAHLDADGNFKDDKE